MIPEESGGCSSETLKTERARRPFPGPPSLFRGPSQVVSGEEVSGLRRPPSEEGEATRLTQEAGEPGPEGEGFSFNFSVQNAVMHRLALLLANPVLIYKADARELASPFSAQCVGAIVFWRE